MGRHRDEIDRANMSRAREANALAAESKRRSAKGKPTVTRAQVDVLLDSMTNEGRAHVAMMATIKAGLRPSTWPR
jgi:hypothetical protein